jgi:hypothetical protein
MKPREEVFRPHYLGRVGVAGQCNCLAKGCKHATVCEIFDLLSLTIVSCSDMCSKAQEESDLLIKDGILYVRVHSHRRQVPLPMVPILLPAMGSCLQSSSVKGVIRKMEITHVAIAETGWQMLHKYWFGRGKLTLKKISNASSDLKCHFGSMPKEWDGILVMKF